MAKRVDDAEPARQIQRMPGRGRRVRYAPVETEQAARTVSGGARTPERSADSTNQAWQDPDDSNDDRLKRDKPPHWG